MPLKNSEWIKHCSTCKEWNRIKDGEMETIFSDIDPNIIHKCPDCEAIIDTSHLDDGEVVGCPCCGLELYYNKVKDELSELTLDGIDWGE